MAPRTVGLVLDAIGKHWHVASDVEVTLEANPTSVEATRFAGYRAAGVNRVSLGVQALDDRSLKELGRLHSAREALDAVAIARRSFDRYSFDLIYARPGQTPEMWADELRLAIAEAAEHLSLYQLTIEEGTPFFGLHAAGKLKTPDEGLARALYDVTQEVCARHSLPAYEISNHARPGAECRHNLVYWRGDEYAGIGPGAHGRLDIGGTRHATATEKRPEAWLMRVEASGHGVTTDELLNSEERADEFLLMGLRLAEGIDPDRYAALAGRPLDPDRIALLTRRGRDRGRRRRAAARHAGRISRARCGGGGSGGVEHDPKKPAPRLDSGVGTGFRKRSYAQEKNSTRQNSSESLRPGRCRRWRRASPRARARWCRRGGSGTARRCRQSRMDWSTHQARTAAALVSAPAPRPVLPRHRQGLRCAPARRRIWCGSGRRRRGSLTDLARRTGRLAARAGGDARIVPQPGAEHLDIAQVRARGGQRVRGRDHRFTVIGNQ